MNFYTDKLTTPQTQYYLQHLIAPRPICFATTVDAAGSVNLSPFSFFNLFSSNPPVVIFSPARRVRDNTTKHSLENIREVPEVAISIVSYDMVQQVSLSSCEYPKDTDEFIKAGFNKRQSQMIRPPFVKEAKAALECRVNEIKSLGNQGGAGQLVIAEVICFHIDDDLLHDGKITEPQKLDLVARMGDDWYTRVSGKEMFRVEKPNVQLGIGIDALPEAIRNSRHLSGNQLARLANVHAVPEKQTGFRSDRLDQLRSSLGNSGLIENIHYYLQELIDANEIALAWQVILATNDSKT